MKQGLKKTLKDPRDYHYQKTFGNAYALLPHEYFAGYRKIKTQRGMMCTAFATNIAAECEDNVEFCPEWFWLQEKAISGSSYDEGEDLRTPMKAAVQAGFLPLSTVSFDPSQKDDSFISIPQNWENPATISSKNIAAPFRKKSFFRVDGLFQNIKQILYQNRQFNRAIVTGVQWYNEWTMAPGGVVPITYNSPAGLHCICIIGFTEKDGVEYIVVQDCDGETVGDHGLFYFTEGVFNHEFTEPMYMLVDRDGQTEPQPIGNFFSILLYKLMKLL